MSQPDAKQAIALLLQQRAQLLAIVRTRLHAEGQADSLGLVNHLEETGDWAEASSENLHDLALLQHEIETLNKLDAALTRARSGQYGQCQYCGESIAPARLAVQPDALACLSCQSKLEQGRALHA
jgi:DnaK suppressor protein